MRTRAIDAPRWPRARGFTLVELIVVILIIGILSTLALPRFIDMGSDARMAKAQSIMGSIRSASRAVRAAAQVRGQTGAAGNVVIDGVPIATTYGYPQALATGNGAAGILDAAGMDTTGGNSDRVTLSGGGAAALVIAINGAPAPATCYVSYTAPAADGAPPAIAMNTAGC